MVSSSRPELSSAEVIKDSKEWSNAAWIEALRGSGVANAEAAQGLSAFLHGITRKLMRSQMDAGEIDDLVQESLTRILAHLDSFRGDSAFTTWSAAIATRVVFEHLRRAAVRRRHTDAFLEVQREVENLEAHRSAEPVAVLAREQLVAALQHAIAHSITARQRTAILAELRGIPTLEIAARMGTNTNALYKLTHDARKALLRALQERGFDASSLLDFEAETKA